MQAGHRPFRDKGGPGTQPSTCQVGGKEAAAASRAGCPFNCSSRRLGKLRGVPLAGGPSWRGAAGQFTSPSHLSPSMGSGSRGQTQISNQMCVLGSCSIDTEARRAQG